MAGINKLEVINRALAATGNNTLVQLNDGTDEAIQSEFAFERVIARLIGEFQWPFRLVTEPLVRTGTSTLGAFTDTFAIPSAAWHLRDVVYEGSTVPADYRIANGVINAYASSGLVAEYVQNPVLDSTWHPSAVEVLTLLVEAHLLRGMNEDFRSAEQREQTAEQLLLRARSRAQQQEPARNAYRGSMAMIRRFRRGSWNL